MHMLNRRFFRVIPAVVFLFFVLEIFELVLVISGMDEIERLETEIRDNLKALEHITILLNGHLECMNKKIKIK